MKKGKNKQITSVEDGKKYWDSRSVAVVAIVYSVTPDGTVAILLHRRGPGCPDNVGKWSVNCGYLDWGEYLPEAVVREIWEETGLDLRDKPDLPEIIGINDSLSGKQNVTIRYRVKVPFTTLTHALYEGTINTDTARRGGEPGEVSEFKLLFLGTDPAKAFLADSDKWAFGHNQLITNTFSGSGLEKEWTDLKV